MNPVRSQKAPKRPRKFVWSSHGRASISRLAFGIMRAVVATAFGGPDVLSLVEQDVPRPAPGEVAIDVHYAGVNFAEVMGRSGAVPALHTPIILGLEVSGFIRELGAGVKGLLVGDPVCALTGVGGYAEIAVAAASSTHILPDREDSTLRLGAALPTIVPTAWSLIYQAAKIVAGEDVLVSAAAGGVGTLLGQLARRAGARQVLGVVGTTAKVAYASKFGYDHVFVEDDWERGVEEVTDGRGLAVVLDSVGGSFRRAAFEVLAPMGRLVFFGNASGEPQELPNPEIMRSRCQTAVGFSITGLTRLDPERARRYSEAGIALAISGELKIDITQAFPLAEAASAHRELENRRTTGKIVLEMHGSG